jgi:hypothetical protein
MNDMGNYSGTEYCAIKSPWSRHNVLQRTLGVSTTTGQMVAHDLLMVFPSRSSSESTSACRLVSPPPSGRHVVDHIARLIGLVGHSIPSFLMALRTALDNAEVGLSDFTGMSLSITRTGSSERARKVFAEHRDILEAIRNRDPAWARRDGATRHPRPSTANRPDSRPLNPPGPAFRWISTVGESRLRPSA